MTNIRIREFVFGMQDGILSTVALATSIAVAGSEKSIIIVAATAAAIAGTISMSTGSYLSSKAYLETLSVDSDIVNESLKDALTMGISFVIGAIIPIIPHIMFSTNRAIPTLYCSSFFRNVAIFNNKFSRTIFTLNNHLIFYNNLYYTIQSFD